MARKKKALTFVIQSSLLAGGIVVAAAGLGSGCTASDTDAMDKEDVSNEEIYISSNPVCWDLDGDGYLLDDGYGNEGWCGGSSDVLDCDDDNRDVHPFAEELCDGIDNDCDGRIDEDGACDETQVTSNPCWIEDNDNDGFEIETGFCRDDSRDCDDFDATVHEGAEELCDGKDNDCDGEVDEDGACGEPVIQSACGEEFNKECSLDEECTVGFQVVDCCGTLVAIGLNGGEAERFAAACDTSLQSCGCEPKPTAADDGSAGNAADVQWACIEGACQTYFPTTTGSGDDAP